MKKTKLISLISGMLFAVAMVFLVPMTVNATWVSKDADTNGVSFSYGDTCYIGSIISTDMDYAAGSGYAHINLSYDGKAAYIGKVKSSNKKVTAKLTNTFSSKSGSESRCNEYRISYYSAKKCKSTISFDVYDKDGNKIDTKKFNVKFVDSILGPIKYVKYGSQYITKSNYKYDDEGKCLNPDMRYTTKKSGKLKVKLNKGYTLKKITVTTYKKNGIAVTKTIKNNKRIKVTTVMKGTETYSYKTSNYSFGTQTYRNPLMVPTRVEITYYDKKNKETDSYTYTIYFLNKK